MPMVMSVCPEQLGDNQASQAAGKSGGARYLPPVAKPVAGADVEDQYSAGSAYTACWITGCRQ